ncbi:MAG: GNAT family N-acetyltransferase [Candidatus Heimdallarchaeota archaeon]|nr:GNAT family N-acetyltransferase [Candidatus Heimdallarchaeota archaeon]MCK5048385.1 GNAT family N-acetyltransferase [Candidatus Heimdallarchaeota archaeon]
MIIREIENEDIDEYVKLNLSEVENWQKITEEGLIETPWEKLSALERWQQGGWWVDRELAELHLQILHEVNGGVIIVEEEESKKIIGSLDYVFDEDHRGMIAHIIWMIIDPSERRKGIGGQLLDELKEKCKERGAKFIDVQFEDERSEGLYLKNGFTLREKLFRVELSFFDFEEEEEEEEYEETNILWEESKTLKWEEVPEFEGMQYIIGYYYPAKYEWVKASYVEKREEIMDRVGLSSPKGRMTLEETTKQIAIFGREAHLWITSLEEKKHEEAVEAYLEYSFLERDTIIANVNEKMLKLLKKKGFKTKAEEAEILTFDL